MTHRFTARARCVLLIVLAATAGEARAADEDGAITPYRPSVSNPAQLPAAGQLELELGGLHTRSDGARRSSVPYDLKLAFSKEWGVLVSGDAHVWLHDDTGNAQGLGDTFVVLKRAWIVDEATAYGMELSSKLPTANDSIGTGAVDYMVNTIFSRDLGRIHMDANLNAAHLGAADPGSSHTQIGASAAFSTALSERWGLTGEASGTRRAGAASSTQWLTAITYSPSKRLTFDLGVARAAHPAPATNQVFAGVVLPLARLW